MATLVVAAGTVSCNNDNNYEYNTSNECIITSMTIGTLKREMHTKNSKGEDSTFYVSVTGALYPMSIDQKDQKIYNLDSLPLGTNVNKAVFASMNTIGTFSIRSLVSGNDTIFKLSDSTDFSVPRIITVHATDGVSKRNYQVTLNVHKENGDSMVWKQLATSTPAFASLNNTRSWAVEEQLYIFGEENGASKVLSTNANGYLEGNTPQWYVEATSTSIKPQSVVRFQNQFYAVNATSNIFVSTDGIEWTALSTDFTASTLVVGSTKYIIALKDGQFYSSTDGIQWNPNTADETEFLPTDGATGTCVPSRIDKTFETLVVVGSQNGKNVVWKREIDLTGNEEYPWIFLPETENSRFNIPNYKNITLTTYDGVTMLAGLNADGNVAPLLLSRDNGRTWKEDGIYTPAAQAQNALAVNVDKNNFIWMFCGQTGQVWRGRINRLGWDEIHGHFEKSNHR